MVTNLKKSKKIRAFCYRMIAVAALITAIGTALMGREALIDACYYGPEIFSGNIYNLPEFREYIGELFNNAMIGYSGIGDDMGYPLTDVHAKKYARQAEEDFNSMVKSLGEDITYYIQKFKVTTEGERAILSNVTYPIFSEYDGHLLLPEDRILCCYWDGESGTLKFFEKTGRDENAYSVVDDFYEAQYKPNKEAAADLKLVLAVREDCQSGLLAQMEHKAEKYQELMIVLAVSVITCLICGLFSLFSSKAGRTAREEFAEFSGKMLLEIKLILIALSILVLLHFDLTDFGMYQSLRMLLYNSLWIYFPIGCLIYLLYADIRQNGGAVFLNSLPVKAVRGIVELVRKKPWYRRAMGLCVATLIGGVIFMVIAVCLFSLNVTPYYYVGGRAKQVLLVCDIVLILTGILLFCIFAGQKKLLKDTASVVSKLSDMREGQGDVPLQLSKHSLLAAAADDLNELENGIEKAVELQNRSNKMRVELLTNVSHDLKTPLTSIINYADLLCEEELPETAATYATALQDKAYRLKNMVQDVFDLSKATSGNLKVESTVIDLVKLIKQTLGDMDERIQKSSLTFKLNISTEPLLIDADGEKLYRVFQNLFVNALQYSLENSRVHIQLLEENGFAVAKVKNTSRMELNFDASEIIERFVRADASRTTEGSGLGLSIVQSFAEACGGQFKVETDADMFTACVSFPLAKPAAASSDEEAVDY